MPIDCKAQSIGCQNHVMYASFSRTYSRLQASALGMGLFNLAASGSFGSGGASDLTSLVNFC